MSFGCCFDERHHIPTSCLLYTSNIQSVITIDKDILQVVYVYEPGIDPYVNKAGGALIFYRTSTTLKGDISDDHKIHKVIDTESVDGTKVTFCLLYTSRCV